MKWLEDGAKAKKEFYLVDSCKKKKNTNKQNKTKQKKTKQNKIKRNKNIHTLTQSRNKPHNTAPPPPPSFGPTHNGTCQSLPHTHITDPVEILAQIRESKNNFKPYTIHVLGPQHQHYKNITYKESQTRWNETALPHTFTQSLQANSETSSN